MSHRPPTRRSTKRAQNVFPAAKDAKDVATDAPENISGQPEAVRPANPVVTAKLLASKATPAKTHYRHVCPKCHGRFVRMHRRFADRLLSMFHPVRRYGCTNHQCRYEAVLWRRHSLTQRPIFAAAGLAGAALAGAVVMAVGLYVASDDSTRAQVRDAYTSATHQDATVHHDATLASPVSRHDPEPKYENASLLELSSQSGDLTVDFMPPVPTLAPAANAGVARPADRE